MTTAALPRTPRRLSGPEKAAAMFLWFFPEAAEAVLKELDAETIERLQDEAKRLESAVTETADPELLIEFEQMLSLTAAHLPPTNAATSTTATEQQSPTEKPVNPVADFGTPSEDPLADLERLPIPALAQALQREQPRTIAILINRVSPRRTAELLAALPEDRRVKVTQELARDPRSPDILVRRLAQAVIEHALSLPTENAASTDRVQRLASVIRAVEKSQRGAMIAAIEQQEPELAGQLLGQIYVFEDLCSATDRIIQGVLAQVDTNTLATALKDSSEALQERISKNLSTRARQALKEEMEFLTQVSPKKVEQARQSITQALAKIDRQSEAE
jgi:flagellar motor switch protein FliG